MAEAVILNPTSEDVPGENLDLGEVARRFLSVFKEVAGEEKEVPPIPSEGVVVVVATTPTTFAGQVWPPGTILNLGEPDPDHPLESDDHENAFLRAVRDGEEWTKDLAVWYPADELEEANQRSYQAYNDWLAELRARSGIESLDAALQVMGATVSRTGEEPRQVTIPAGPDIRVTELPERVVTIGARLGDDS